MRKLWLERAEALALISEIAKGNVGPFDLHDYGPHWLHSSPLFVNVYGHWATAWASPA